MSSTACGAVAAGYSFWPAPARAHEGRLRQAQPDLLVRLSLNAMHVRRLPPHPRPLSHGERRELRSRESLTVSDSRTTTLLCLNVFLAACSNLLRAAESWPGFGTSPLRDRGSSEVLATSATGNVGGITYRRYFGSSTNFISSVLPSASVILRLSGL
jgi:hypothetical protein